MKKSFQGAFLVIYILIIGTFASAQTSCPSHLKYLSISTQERSELRDRITLASYFLGREIGPIQGDAIIDAHFVGKDDVGADGRQLAGIENYTLTQILQKTRILRGAGFNNEEIRILMKGHIVGLAKFLARTIGVLDPATGETVKLKKAAMDDNGNVYEALYVKRNGQWIRKDGGPAGLIRRNEQGNSKFIN